MKMNQVQSAQKTGDTGVPSPEMRPAQIQQSQSLVFQNKINQLTQSGQSIQSQSFNQIRDISPLTHKQLNALSPNKSNILQTQKKRNHKIPCPAHQDFDISNMCTAEGCLEPLCAECIRIHTQLHNSEGTTSNIDTIYNKRDQCIEILREQTNLFNQERAVLTQIGDSTRDNMQKTCLEKIAKAKEKVQYIVDQYFKELEEVVKQKVQHCKGSQTIEHQKNLDSKLSLIIKDIEKMETQLNSEEFINGIIQILSGEYDHNYEKIQQEINEIVEKSASELFEVEFDESKLYTLNIEMQKLLFVRPQSMDGLLNKTLELSKVDVVQSRFESPLKKHNQSVISHIVGSQSKNLFTTNPNNNSQSLMLGMIQNARAQTNENSINQQTLQNAEQQYNDQNRQKVLISQKPPQSQSLSRNISSAINATQITKANNQNYNNQVGLDQFMHVPKSQRAYQQRLSNNSSGGGDDGQRQTFISSIQPSLNLSRDTSPNRNSLNIQEQYGGRMSRSKQNQKQEEEPSEKKIYTFNEITSMGQNTEREMQQRLNDRNSLRQNNHFISNQQDNNKHYVSSKSQEKYFNYGGSNPPSQRPSVSQQGEERITQSINLDQSTGGLYPQVQISAGDYFSPQNSRKFLHFFQDNSKIFHYLDLEILSKDPQSQAFQQQVLNIQFKIPMYHRSIITSYGDAFITGGVDVNQKSYVLNTCYKLNYRQATLEPISSMYYPRSNHGIAFCGGYIYVVGGSTNQDNSCLDKCERYDVEIGRWEQISSLNQKCSGCTLSAFSNRFLFKFGGNADIFTMSNTIERYDIQSNEWKIIPFNIVPNTITMKLPSFSGACQINKDEILLVGGSNHSNRLQNVILVRMYSEECDVILMKPLPRGGTFWQNPIVLGGVVFGLQNITMDKSPDHCYFGKKRILAFNSQMWKQIGSDEIEYYNSSNTSNLFASHNQSQNQSQSQILNNSNRQLTASKSPYTRGGGSNLKSSSQLKRVFYD